MSSRTRQKNHKNKKTERFRQMKMCKKCNKRTYCSREQALHYLLLCSLKQGVALRYYPCPVGFGFHLTSKVNGLDKASV